MGAPNIQQQLYLKKALNENMDGMFDHPKVQNEETITEGYHNKAMRAAGTPKFWGLENRATASELRRGGASKRTMKKYFNTDDYAAGTRAMQRFEKKARAKRNAALGSDAARISTHATKMDAKRKAARIAEDTITEGLLNKIELAEGSRGQARLGRMMKSLIRNRQQGKKMIGKAPKDFHTRSLVSPNDPEVKAYKEKLSAGVAHMGKKSALRRQINARTRAAAMRERGRAGLHPALNRRDVLSPSIPSAAHQGKPINVTGGYEHQENPKRIPKAVQKYRDASWRKMMRGKKS